MNNIPLSSLQTDASLMFRVAGMIPKTPRRLLFLSHGEG